MLQREGGADASTFARKGAPAEREGYGFSINLQKSTETMPSQNLEKGKKDARRIETLLTENTNPEGDRKSLLTTCRGFRMRKGRTGGKGRRTAIGYQGKRVEKTMPAKERSSSTP